MGYDRSALCRALVGLDSPTDEKIYDPWGVEPNVTVRSLTDLPAALEDGLSYT
jgi:hypothetical protein